MTDELADKAALVTGASRGIRAVEILDAQPHGHQAVHGGRVIVVGCSMRTVSCQ